MVKTINYSVGDTPKNCVNCGVDIDVDTAYIFGAEGYNKQTMSHKVYDGDGLLDEIYHGGVCRDCAKIHMEEERRGIQIVNNRAKDRLDRMSIDEKLELIGK